MVTPRWKRKRPTISPASFFFKLSFNTFLSFNRLSRPPEIPHLEGPKRANDQPDDLTVNEPNRNGRLSRSNFVMSLDPAKIQPPQTRKKKKRTPTMEGFSCQKKNELVVYRHRIDMSSPFWLGVELSRFLLLSHRGHNQFRDGTLFVSWWWIESRVCEGKPHVSSRKKIRGGTLFGQTQPGSCSTRTAGPNRNAAPFALSSDTNRKKGAKRSLFQSPE